VALARDPAQAWEQVDTPIAAKKTHEYDTAVVILKDLRALNADVSPMASGCCASDTPASTA
jgi:hypothetical protein